jgi:DNA replication protein DnaC
LWNERTTALRERRSRCERRKCRRRQTVDLVCGLEEESRLGKAGALASQLSRLDLIVFDKLGYLLFTRSGGQLLFHLVTSSTSAPG